MSIQYRSEIGIGNLRLARVSARTVGSVIGDLSGDEHPLYIEESDRGSYFKFIVSAASEHKALGEARAIVSIALRSIGVKDSKISLAKVEVIRET